ncbi:MAG: SMU1112c/YaeR family gloxylase I-like metalloprotein, partial [Sphingobacterium sp.]
DYQISKKFYTKVLGLEVIQETYRADRDSYKLDLAIHGQYCIELFSFPNPKKRMTGPEASGLRHLAFQVEDLEVEKDKLAANQIPVEPIRIDPLTGKKFTFLRDPDDLPIELYEI